MPKAVSKAQFRLMQAAAHGAKTKTAGLTEEKAAEYVAGQHSKGLPEFSKPKRRTKR